MYALFAGMNPRNVRSLLSRFGEIDRIYFEPGRLRNGLPVSYREGWVEFKKKKVAKHVAQLLNGSEIACRKRAAYCGSVWAIKYLRRVKWHDLSEQVNLEKESRDQRLRMEMSRVKKESDFYADQMYQLKRREKQSLQASDEVLDRRKHFYTEKQNKAVEAPSKQTVVGDDLLQRLFA